MAAPPLPAEGLSPAPAAPADEPRMRADVAMVWRFLRMLGADAATADDLTQETFLRLLRARPDDRGELLRQRWLRTTARNLWRTDRRRRIEPVSWHEAEIEAAFAANDRGDGGESYRVALRACLASMPERERRAVVARYGHGGSRAAVAELLGVQGEGAKSVLRRALVRLKQCVRRRLGDEA